MDPIAHTLVGAALAKSGIEKRCAYAAAALIVGANLPDIDGLTYFFGSDLGLYFRRGWTHGLPAIALWPLVLAGALSLLDRLLGRGQARFGPLFALSLLAVATHPALDWLNNYGMRFFMPFDDRWFYADAVWAEIVEEPEGFRVSLRDARYARNLRSDGFGTAVVFLLR